MTRTETTIEEIPEPAVFSYRRANPGSRIEAVLVIGSTTYIIPVSDHRAIIHVADLSGFLATRPTGAP